MSKTIIRSSWSVVVSLFAVALIGAGCMTVIPAVVPSVDAEADIGVDFPFESKFVDVLDSRMHYVDVGEGAPIVFLHGNPTSSYLWRNVIPHVAKPGRRVIAVDNIGMGKSGKPELAYRLEDHVRYFDAFIETLQLKDVVLVLHDWGGGIGFDHAMRHQENIRAIVFMEAVVVPFSWDHLSPPEQYLFRTMRGPDGDELMLDDNYFVEKLLPAFAGRKLSPAEMDAYRAPYLERAHRLPTRMWPREVPFEDGPMDNRTRVGETFAKLKASDVPLLLLTADPGGIIKPRLVEILKKELPRMQTQPIGAGIHFIQETQPTRIGQSIDRWVGELSAWSQSAEQNSASETTSTTGAAN